MKMLMLFAGLGILFLSVVVTSAQSPTFLGKWILETKSPLVPPNVLVMNVSQNNSELKVELVTNLETDENVKNRDFQTKIYDLSGKQTVMYENDNPERIAAELDAALQPDGKLILNMNRFMTDKNEKFTMKRKSVWELVEGGKKLKVTEYMELPDEKAGISEGITMYYAREE